MSYEVIRYRPEHRLQVLELETHLWSPDLDLNDTYLRWKYDENPYLKDPLIVVALHEGIVVGVRGAYGAEWRIGPRGRRWVAPCVGDIVIAPEHRDRQLFTRLNKAVMDAAAATGHRFVLNLSAGAVTHLSLRAMGFRSLGSLEMLQRIGDRWRFKPEPEAPSWSARVRSALEVVRPKAWRPRKNPFTRFDDVSASRRHAASRAVSASRSPAPAEMGRLIAWLDADDRVRHVRDERYLSWRFRNPLSEYRFLYARSPQLEGYLVLRAKADVEPGRTSIIDWEAKDREVAKALLEAAVAWAGFENLDIWSATLASDRIEALRAQGFEPVKPDARVKAWHPGILVRALASDGDWKMEGLDLTEIGNWDLRMCYSDGY
jgi:GNAT superfamily N-acetyltransferase